MSRMLTLITLIALWISSAAAETFCVSTAVELQSALWQSQNNGQHDEIRIERGFYSTEENGSLGLGFSYSTIENGNLTIMGGYSEGCPGFRGIGDAFTTVLDGGGVHQVLAIFAGDSGAIVSVRNLTIQSGYPYSDEFSVGGLYIKGFGDDALAERVNIKQVAFIGNEAAAGASALGIESQGRVDVSNSLFLDNIVNALYTAIISRSTSSSEATYFINNTVVNNTALDSTTGASGIWLNNTSSSGNVAANNVFWNNSGLFDLAMSGPGGSISNNHLLHNIVQNAFGFGGTNIGNSTADPLFDTDFSLQQDSPARDAGFSPPTNPNPPVELDWSLDLFDITYRLRLLGPGVDMGAFEYRDQLFADSFE